MLGWSSGDISQVFEQVTTGKLLNVSISYSNFKLFERESDLAEGLQNVMQ